nr:anthocyanidin 3-O-glucosyltransferase 5-like [Tanacetum cinerariifolium]
MQKTVVESQLLRSLTDGTRIDIIKIPLPDISNLLEPNDLVITQLAIMMREARQAGEFHMQKYVYLPCLARFLAPTTYMHVLDKKVTCQYVDQIEPLKVPGCESVHCEDVPDPMLDRTNRQYDEYVRLGIDFTSLSHGIMLNTWIDMDYASLDALKYNQDLRSVVKVPVYDIGPLSREVNPASSHGNKEGLSHRGLNSVYESKKGCVPMISWPLYVEQRLNATILVKELEVAIRSAVLLVKKVVGRDEIKKMVISLMEGVEGSTMKERVKVLRDSTKEAFGFNDSSYKSMCEFITRCVMKMKFVKPNS